jgi:hypothetical protein
MSPSIRSNALMSLVLAVTACAADPAATEPEAGLAAAVGPAEPGASGLFRFEDVIFLVTRDEVAGLISVHGLNNTVAEFCAGLGDLDLAQFQVKPQTAGEANALISARESPVQILGLEPGQLLCRDLQDAPVLYQGTASLRRTDNNLTPTGTEGGRANSYGWMATGVLEEVATGLAVNYLAVTRFEVDPQTGQEFVLVSRIEVH